MPNSGKAGSTDNTTYTHPEMVFEVLHLAGGKRTSPELTVGSSSTFPMRSGTSSFVPISLSSSEQLNLAPNRWKV